MKGCSVWTVVSVQRYTSSTKSKAKLKEARAIRLLLGGEDDSRFECRRELYAPSPRGGMYGQVPVEVT